MSSMRPQDCDECVQSCDADDCDVELTEQCTDECVVVACDDPHHAPLDPALDPACDMPCTDANCTTLDEFFQCCVPPYHTHTHHHPRSGYVAPMPHTSPSSSAAAYTWDPSLDALLAGANHNYHPPAHDLFHADPPHYSSQSSSSFSSPPELYAPAPAFAIDHAHSTPVSPALSAVEQATTAPVMAGFKCMWASCEASFTTMSDLVGHVNLQHLRLPALAADPAPPQPPIVPDTLSCMWADCQLYPTPSSVPGPSSGNQTDSAIGVLASHLLQDHLGLPTITPATAPLPSPVSPQSPVPQSAATAISTTSSSLTGPPTPGPEHDCAAPNAHVCRWETCGKSFTSCDDLTKHITDAHVGSGKAHYDCYWEGCKRNGTSGFASKQKICRHLQSHTGHRPFQCQVCQQNFSEAATLAQHMRRHTQEKPYVCDFPGCGKSFAITGALTIHKRTHNGHKPFKCTYCERAFAESSNLSKHLRTHTGARPYPCTYPECAKSFARPDQLARHMAVHKKNEKQSAAAAMVDESGVANVDAGLGGMRLEAGAAGQAVAMTVR